MPDNIDPQSVRVSIKIYERLLATYPAAFRREYGQSMKQLFRDQCRDAWSESGRTGMTFLWFRVLADWAKTLVVEHVSNLNERKFDIMNALRSATANPQVRGPFFRVFAVVVIPAIVCSLVIVFASPRIYSSTVRIEVQNPKYWRMVSTNFADSEPYFMITQCKIIESWQILTNVIADLDLNKKIPQQIDEQPWTTEKTYLYLAKMVNATQTRMTGLIEINVKNPSSLLAANIANKIAFWYKIEQLNQWRKMRDSSGSNIQPDSGIVIVRDPARPERKPVFPNPRIIIIAILGGMLLALIAGGIAALVGRFWHASRSSPSQASG